MRLLCVPYSIIYCGYLRVNGIQMNIWTIERGLFLHAPLVVVKSLRQLVEKLQIFFLYARLASFFIFHGIHKRFLHIFHTVNWRRFYFFLFFAQCINQFINFKVAPLLLNSCCCCCYFCRFGEFVNVCQNVFTFCHCDHAHANANAHVCVNNSSHNKKNCKCIFRETHKMHFSGGWPGGAGCVGRLIETALQFICHFVTLTQWKCNMLMSNFMNERKIICLADALGINIKIAIRKQRERERE